MRPDDRSVSEEILINVTPRETRVAVVENGMLQEVHIERALRRGYVGNIYKGKVSRVMPGMQAAFVEIGLERAAFLHASDIVRASPSLVGDSADSTAPAVTPPILDLVREGHVRRVPGLAVFPHPDAKTVPLALRQNLEFNHVLHEHVAIVTIINENVPHIRHVDRALVNDLGYADDGIVHISYRVGFNDSQFVPKALEWAQGKTPEMDLDPSEARYFLSSLRLQPRDVPTLRPRWRRQIFLWLSRNATQRTQDFHLPAERTIVIGGNLEM